MTSTFSLVSFDWSWDIYILDIYIEISTYIKISILRDIEIDDPRHRNSLSLCVPDLILPGSWSPGRRSTPPWGLCCSVWTCSAAAVSSPARTAFQSPPRNFSTPARVSPSTGRMWVPPRLFTESFVIKIFFISSVEIVNTLEINKY